MVYSAEYIKKKLEQEMILSQAFGRDLVSINVCHILNTQMVDSTLYAIAILYITKLNLINSFNLK